MQSILDALNAQQRQAVEAPEGPTLVLAGPGSGKTRVLTARAAFLLARGVPPPRLMAVTFTNKAAQEMRERIERLVGVSAARDLWLGTFHSLCARLLRREADRAGLNRDFSIYDTDDQLSVVKAVMAELKVDEKKHRPSAVHAVISNAKNALVKPEHFQPQSYHEEIAARVYPRYNALLRANNALDFDDLIAEAVWLLERDEIVRAQYQERLLHVLVDEFQDTNFAQYALLKLLVGKHRNLFCVGDPDQGIYAWRGADHRNVQRLLEDFRDARVITLEQNYRSTQVILDAAMAIIRKNPDRRPTRLVAQRSDGPKIVVRELFDENEEAQYVVDTIAELVRRKAAQPGEIAVMYRTNAQSRALEDAFIRASMPYRLVGATRFYARKEIRDVLAYLRIVNNPADTVSLQRIINVPPRGIGEKTFKALESAAYARGITCLELITSGELEGRAARALSEFGALWQQWIRLRDELNVSQLLDHILQTSGYREFLLDGTPEGEERWANVNELRSVAAEAGDMMLAEFLANIALVSDVDNYDEHANAPTLLTLHAAKGLEFRVVFIVGLVEGVLPHSRSMDDEEGVAEERRLMYVGITRAKERLYLLYPFWRRQWGSNDAAEPSRFLLDLPEALLDVHASIFAAKGKPSAATWDRAVPSSAPARRTRFKPGDRVVHPEFGEGVVLSSALRRDDEEVEVFFLSVGGKRLSVALSGLRRA